MSAVVPTFIRYRYSTSMYVKMDGCVHMNDIDVGLYIHTYIHTVCVDVFMYICMYECPFTGYT